MNKLLITLSFMMGVVVLASNYLVQFPVNHYGLNEILTYGAFSYPIAFLITDLANRSFGKIIAKKNCLFRFYNRNFIYTYFFNKLWRLNIYKNCCWLWYSFYNCSIVRCSNF